MTYSDGKYRNAVVEFVPEAGTHILIVPSVINAFTEKARTMLTRRILKVLDASVQVSQASGINDSGLMISLHELLEKLLVDNFVDVSASSSVHPGVRVVVFVHDISNLDQHSPGHPSIEKQVAELLSLFEWRLDFLHFNELADGAPSAFQIVRIVYIKAPIAFLDIYELLENSGTPAPSERWLRRQLDGLVRKAFLIWQKGDQYLVTASGIAMLPMVKGRNSPDVIRALDLAKRKW